MVFFSLLKNLFIPHQGNGFRPQILEQYFGLAVAVIVLIKILSLTSYTSLITADIFNQISPADIYAATNADRTQNHLGQLVPNHQLETAAELKLNDVINKGYFAHVSPQGIEPWDWFTQAHYNYAVAGENLAMDFNSTADVMDAWMNSPEHRQNILLPDFTDIGVAVGSGTINGRQQTIVVEEFGKPFTTIKAASVAATKTVVPISNKAVAVAKSTAASIVFRSQPSSPLKSVPAPKVTLGQIQGAQTVSPVSFTAYSWFNLIFILAALASIAAFLLNIFVAWKVQFPGLIVRSAVLVGICLLAWHVAVLPSHVLIP